MSCTVDSACKKITCCVAFDFEIKKFHLSISFTLDECADSYELQFETWTQSPPGILMNYNWGTNITEEIGSNFNIRYVWF